jgi:streptomycin 6-kinase
VVTGLPADAVLAQLEQWQLRPDGPAIHGHGTLVQPVRTAEETAAVLKLGSADAGSEHEHLVLRRWGGSGAVRLLRADPHRRALLLERLRPQHLDSLSDYEACGVVGELYHRLHVPALPQLRTLTSLVEQWLGEFSALPRNAPIPHRLVEQASALGRDLIADRSGADRVVLHGNLHSGNVLTAGREPWLAIAPRPINGDPHFEIAPMLWHQWDELAGYVRDGVRTRLHTLLDAAGLDEDRARGWAIVRVIHAAVREVDSGSDAAAITRYIALAKAVQD